MRKQISIYLILLFFLCACEKEDVISEPPAKQEEISLGEKTAEENVSDGESSGPEYEEYFITSLELMISLSRNPTRCTLN